MSEFLSKYQKPDNEISKAQSTQDGMNYLEMMMESTSYRETQARNRFNLALEAASNGNNSLMASIFKNRGESFMDYGLRVGDTKLVEDGQAFIRLANSL